MNEHQIDQEYDAFMNTWHSFHSRARRTARLLAIREERNYAARRAATPWWKRWLMYKPVLDQLEAEFKATYGPTALDGLK